MIASATIKTIAVITGQMKDYPHFITNFERRIQWMKIILKIF